MLYLTPSKTRPGHWLLGQQELTAGDVIDVWILGNWYPAKVTYDSDLDQYRLDIDAELHTHGMPLIAGTPARWPERGNQVPAVWYTPGGGEMRRFVS
jgi:hypothetical protein